MKKAFALLLLLIAIQSVAQVKDSLLVNSDKLSFGLGMGLDYGGFGGNFTAYPNKNIGLFVGAGYAIGGFGFNGGVKLRFNAAEANRIKPYLMAMYGYNAIIVVKNETNLNKTFYGPSVGLGLDFKQRSGRKGYWTLAIIFPIRGSEVNDYMDELKADHGVEFERELSPINISLGYRVVFGK